MAIRSDYSDSWFRAGFIFGIASLVMLIIVAQQVGFYYLEEDETRSSDGERHTRSEWCSETRGYMDAGECSQWKFNAQISVALTLISIGFATMCFAQSRYLESHEEDVV